MTRFLIPLVIALSITAAAQTSGTASEKTGKTYTIPEGTVLQIRLRQTISSYGSKAKTPILAIIIAPVESEGRIILPMKTELDGKIKKVRRVGLGLVHEKAYIDIVFDSIRLPDGTRMQIAGQITAVDDSRERVNEKGRITGIRASGSFSSMLSGFAISAGSIDPMMLGFALSSSLNMFRIPESEIILPVGAELRFRLDKAVEVSNIFPPIAPPVAETETEKEALTSFIRPLPFRTATDPGNVPSDLTSLLFIGSKEAIARALDAAGWARADELNARSTYGVMRSVIENQGYQEAPVSTLLLDGKTPVYAYSKTLNTFFKRHHLRVYEHDVTWKGSKVYSSTGTHDSGIGFSKKAKTLIHIIDENIDEERTKIVNDMVLTGCVTGVSYIDRPWVPLDARNATGDSLITDGRIAVLELNNCDTPERSDVPADETPEVKTTQSAFLRPLRNTTLTIRNSFLRGNVIYQGYSGFKLINLYFKSRKSSKDDAPQTIHYGGEDFLIVTGSEKIKEVEGLKDPDSHPSTFQPPVERQSYHTLIDVSFSGGYHSYAGSRFATQPITTPILQDAGLSLNIENFMKDGWTIGGRFTTNSWERFSNEFFYNYKYTSFGGRVTAPGIDPAEVETKAQIRQYGYNFLAHLRKNGARFRPYVAAGPVFQMIRLTESKPQSNAAFRFTIKSLGLIVGSYNFGSKPPLEGGGIFQIGGQFGGGFKFQVTPRFFLRMDFRETISKQPDFWSKSYQQFEDDGFIPLKQVKHGPFRQHDVTIGFGLSF